VARLASAVTRSPETSRAVSSRGHLLTHKVQGGGR
jgi:hypothetical protein